MDTNNYDNKLISLPVKVEINDDYDSSDQIHNNIFVTTLPFQIKDYDQSGENSVQEVVKRKRRTKQEMESLRHLKKFSKIHECDHCGKTAYKKSHLRSHMTIHMDSESKKRSGRPTKCDENERLVECQECSKMVREKYIRKHLRRTHKIKLEKLKEVKREGTKKKKWKRDPNKVYPKLLCDHCGKEISNRKALKNHILAVHLPHLRTPKNLVCEFCGKENFSSYWRLLAHKRTVHQLGNFPCKHCDHVATSETGYRNHLKIRHSKTKLCEICNEWISTKVSLALFRILPIIID